MDHAQMVELVDTQDLKSCSRKRSAGSIPALSTKAPIIGAFVVLANYVLCEFGHSQSCFD